MAPIEQHLLKRAAQRAYEAGRLRAASRIALVLGPLGLAAILLRAPLEAVICLAALVFVGGTAIRWWGKSLGPAVLPGVLGGAVPLILVPLTTLLSQGTCVEPVSACGIAGVTSGLAGGAVIAFLGVGSARPTRWSWFVALAAAQATACVSCVAVGLPALGGASVGLLVGSFSLFVARRGAS